MEFLADWLKTWWLDRKETKERKKGILLGFRAIFGKVSVEIEQSRLNDKEFILSDLKYQIPSNAKRFGELFGQYEPILDENVAKWMESYLNKIVKIGRDIKLLTHDSGRTIFLEIGELNDMSKAGKGSY